MAEFPALKLTEQGQALLLKAQSGELLNFLYLQVGSGNVNEADWETLTALDVLQMQLVFTGPPALDSDFARLDAQLSNGSVTAGFWLTEIGVWAEDPDLGPILYSYSNAGGLGSWIPPAGGASVYQAVLSVYSRIGNAENVTAEIGEFSYLTYVQMVEYVSDHNTDKDAHPPIRAKIVQTQEDLSSHISETNVHGAASAAEADRLIMRDGDGRAQVADPVAAADIATKGYADSIAGSGGSGVVFATNAQADAGTATGVAMAPATVLRSIQNTAIGALGVLTNATITATVSVKTCLERLQGQVNNREPLIAAGTTAQYRRGDKSWQDLATAVRNTALTGLSTATATAVTATDALLTAVGKIQAQLNSKEPLVATGTTAQYRRGDKTWQDLAAAVRAAVMTGLSTTTATAVVATDTLLDAIGKLQAQINNAALPSFATNAQADAGTATGVAMAPATVLRSIQNTAIGALGTLSNVAITATVSVKTCLERLQGQVNNRELLIAAGSLGQYWRGDKSWQDLATAVRNTALTGLSTATATAVTATDALVTAMGKLQAQINNGKPVYGYYSGNGAATRSINLGFQPSVVLVFNGWGKTYWTEINTGTISPQIWGGLAVATSSVASGAVVISATGFSVASSLGLQNSGPRTNDSNQIYNYVAWRS